MLICTFNVNSVRARLELIKSWLEKRNHDIDILCLQETKTVDESFPKDDFLKMGYSLSISGQKAYNGVAVLSKDKPLKIVKEFGSEALDGQKRLLITKFGDLTVINAYAPHGDLPGQEKYKYKQQWYKEFTGYIKENFSKDDKVVILGDLNIAHQDIDVYDPMALEGAIGTLPEERKLFDNLLALGFTDTFRHLYPAKKEFTWWDYTTGAIWRDEGMRIDYVLASKPLLGSIKSVSADLWPRKRRTPTPSDHAPLVIQLF